MAGEWIAYDLALPEKPEVQELIDLTGEPVEVVVFRLLQLWGWASLHCQDGQAKMTSTRLCRVCGGTVDFWQAVESVGWLSFDDEAKTVAVSGWDRRFSQSAKERAAARQRAAEQREKPEKGAAHSSVRKKRTAPCADGAPEERRIERGDIPPPPPRDAAQDKAALRAAWAKAARAGRVQPYRAKGLPPALDERLAEPGWLDEALRAIDHLPKCRYFDTPATMFQLVGAGFVQRVLAGQYDDCKPAKGGRGPKQADDRPPAKAWTGDDAARLEATRKALAGKMQEVA